MLCKNPFTFGLHLARKHNLPTGFTVPCGDCVPCRIAYARFWAVRCYFESLEYPLNLFITLTYDDANIPLDGRLNTRDVQLFLKRYRKAVYPRKIRYFLVGEYGDQTKRPHYHAIIFNGGLYDTEIIKNAWSLGFVQAEVLRGFSGISYCCKYSLKSRRRVSDSELRSRLFCSRRPGIGSCALDFFKKIYDPSLKMNSIMIEGRRYAIPPYYLRQFINDSDREEYMHLNASYFFTNKQEYFDLTKAKIESIEALNKIFNKRKDI